MEVLDGLPRLSIPRDTASSFYSRSGEGLTGRVVRSVPVGSASVAEIALCLDVWGDDSACAICVGLDRVGLLRRVPAIGALRPDRVALTCSACGARFVRPDGAL